MGRTESLEAGSYASRGRKSVAATLGLLKPRAQAVQSSQADWNIFCFVYKGSFLSIQTDTGCSPCSCLWFAELCPGFLCGLPHYTLLLLYILYSLLHDIFISLHWNALVLFYPSQDLPTFLFSSFYFFLLFSLHVVVPFLLPPSLLPSLGLSVSLSLSLSLSPSLDLVLVLSLSGAEGK